MAIASGTRIGPYEVLAPLGAGGMGEVYRARDLQLGRDIAIKVLPLSLSRDPDRLRRFEQEARAAAALNHPNILAVYQMGTYEGAPYLVSELLEGSTLRDQLLRGQLPLRKAVDFGVQTARGLAAAHEKGIVHRDLKPENLFVTRDGRIKILDFGLAKLIQNPHASEPGAPTLTEGTEPGVVLGTVGYMSPEQVRGQGADDRADLFALGTILYEMLTGKRAFQKPTSAETMSAILNEEPSAISQIVPSIPPALQRVVQRCLEKSPEQRFHSASDLAFALEAMSDTGSTPTGAFVSISPRRWTWMLGAGVVIGITVVLTLWLTRSPAVPVVESVVQLTNDGISKTGSVETDGARVYFNEGPTGSFRIAQVSVSGGKTGEIATNLRDPQIEGLKGDGSMLLVAVGTPAFTRVSLWSVPLPAGEARRLGDTDVTDASLFPDGRLLYAVDKAVFTAEKDGANPHKLEEISKYGVAPQVSPDGEKLVFQVSDQNSWTIYEAASDGTRVSAILRRGPGLPSDVCCPGWTADGKYVLFTARTKERWDLWALADAKQLMGGTPEPFRLTNGPVSYDSFTASRDGKQIFAIGAQRRGELVRYDPKAQEFLPFLGGISAFDPTFSRDGKWVAYLAYPEHTLWRSRADGSERLQLTYPPQIVITPRISPDGSRVAFTDSEGSAYVVNMNGGTPRKVADDAIAPDWSPDGNLLAASFRVSGVESHEKRYFSWKIVDLRTGNVSEAPNSRGWVGPWFVTQDTLVAISDDQSRFSLFDLRTQKWTDLMASSDKFRNWEVSPDCRYFYYSTGGNNPRIFRMRMADHAVEEVATLKNLRVVDDPYVGPELGVGPDNSAVVTRDIGTQEVYALSVKWK